MIEPMMSTEAVLKEALLDTLKRTGNTRFDMWEPPAAAIYRHMRERQAARRQTHT
jgi:hypothetical protein